MTPQDPATEAELHIGQVQWYCSEEDGGPDVGILLQVDSGSQLWLGELLDAEGGGMGFVFYGPNQERQVASLSDWNDVRDIIENCLAPCIRGLAHPQPATLERVGWQNAIYALEYWEREAKHWGKSPPWAAGPMERGREEIARHRAALSTPSVTGEAG